MGTERERERAVLTESADLNMHFKYQMIKLQFVRSKLMLFAVYPTYKALFLKDYPQEHNEAVVNTTKRYH